MKTIIDQSDKLELSALLYKVREYKPLNKWGRVIGGADTLAAAEAMAETHFKMTGKRCGVSKR